MRILGLFACLVALSACGKHHDAPAKNGSVETLKIMTYNIRHGAPVNQSNDDVHLEGIAAAINQQKPDLVALQEVDSMTRRAPVNEAEELGKATGMYYYFSKTIDYQGGKYGDAILSRFPILATEHRMLALPDPSGEQRAVAVITVEPYQGVKLNFASTHLDLVAENRTAEVGELIDMSKQSAYPLILCGDLNATPDSKEMQTLQTEFVFPCVVNCPLTFPSDGPKSTIDYIISNPAASKLFHVLSYNAIQNIQASDHLPLMGYFSKQ
jgi:endonuclease/exonuclease/phosphatase family metal-dependent hydrolase